MTDLGAPAYTQGSYPAAVNNVGQVAGSTSIFVNTGYGMAFLANSFFYDGMNMISLPVASLQNLATDVNDAGQVVGTGGGRAYLYEGGVVKDLNTLVPAGTPGLSSASAINNAGQILGYTSSGRGFLLTPDRPPVPGTEWIVDDGAPEFAISGARAGVSSEGYLGDSRRLAPTSRTLGSRRMLLSDRFRSAATWSFAGLEPGTYRVSATWPAGADRATNAPYSVFNGANPLTTVLVNQRGAPNDLAAAGVGWKNLGTFTIGSGGLSVRLTNQTNGWAIADAVRVEKVTATAAAADAVAPAPTRSTPLALRRTAFELLA
jgi:probable HAF family extracellular repeat protein